jgi:transportin-3
LRQEQETREDLTNFLQRIIQPIESRLNASSVNGLTCTPKHDSIPELDRPTVLVRFVMLTTSSTSAYPILDVIQLTWLLLEAALNQFPQDRVLEERTCRLDKHALRACGPAAYDPMFDPLVEQLIWSREQLHQAPFLYRASLCITEFGHDPHYSKRLLNMINAIASVSLSFLRNLNDLTQVHVEELFYLMGRMISHCPKPLVLSPLLLPLF